jgi:precorrin-3B synthase
VRGWCPGVFDPLLTGDGWLVRVRCPGGVVTPVGLRVVAELATAGGSGQLELTSRANLQLRGLREGGLDSTGRELVSAGLAAADAAADGWRAIVSSPLAGHDPTAAVDSGPVVAALADELARAVDGSPPTKFGIVVDDGGCWPLDHLDADLYLRALPGGGWSVALRGPGWVGRAHEPRTVAITAARLCATEGDRVDRVIGGRGLPSVLDAIGVTPTGPAPMQPDTAARSDRPGVRDHPQPNRCSLVAAPFLGRLDATALRALAAVAERDALVIRLTTARSIALCGVRRDRLGPVKVELEALGLLTTPTDPRALLSACVGSRGCESARGDTWAEAERLASAGSARVHLSGCEKACGAPQGVTHLIAVEGGRFVERTA